MRNVRMNDIEYRSPSSQNIIGFSDTKQFCQALLISMNSWTFNAAIRQNRKSDSSNNQVI